MSDLLAAYWSARAEAHAQARYAIGDARRQICRYCGEHRAAPFSTHLNGHAVCVVTPAFCEQLLRELEAGLQMQDVGVLLGVTQKTLRLWYRAAMDAREAA